MRAWRRALASAVVLLVGAAMASRAVHAAPAEPAPEALTQLTRRHAPVVMLEQQIEPSSPGASFAFVNVVAGLVGAVLLPWLGIVVAMTDGDLRARAAAGAPTGS